MDVVEIESKLYRVHAREVSSKQRSQTYAAEMHA